MVFQFRARTSELLFLSMGASLKGEELLHDIEVCSLVVCKAHAFMIITHQLGPHREIFIRFILQHLLSGGRLYSVLWLYFEASDKSLGKISFLISRVSCIKRGYHKEI